MVITKDRLIELQKQMYDVANVSSGRAASDRTEASIAVALLEIAIHVGNNKEVQE